MYLSRSSRKDKLKQLKEARKAGTSLNISDEEVESEVGEIYDEVDEDTFRSHKRKQMMNDDFIVDDDGEGYVDNGVDEWDDSTRPNYYSDEEVEDNEGSKKRKRQQKKPIKTAKTSQINNFFKPKAFTSTAPKPKTVDTSIDDILDDFDTPMNNKKPKTNMFDKPKTNASVSKPSKPSKNPFSFTSKRSTPKPSSDDMMSNSDSVAMDDQPSSPIQTEVKESIDNTTDSVETKNEEKPSVEQKQDDFDDDSDDDLIVTRRPKATAINDSKPSTITASKPEVKSSSPIRNVSSPSVNYTEKLEESNVVNHNENNQDSFKMFWLDYCEVDNSLLIFGKVQTNDGKLVSGVVQVNGLCRELYFLPRQYRKVEGQDDPEDEVSALDIHEEIVPLLLDKYNLNNIKAKPETMKYAFELPGVPKESECLKVLLPYKTPKNRHIILPADLEGETFSHVFGANANIFESFVLQRNIMGPCWLEISNADFNSVQNIAHCQVEVSVDVPGFISPVKEKIPTPDLTLMSIAVQTVMNQKDNKQEVASVSIGTYRDIPQDSPVDGNRAPNDMVTLVRPVNSVSTPPGLSQLAQKQNLNVRTFPNEKSMLNCFAALIKNQDPDVYIGHRLENISLDVLVHRMYDLKVANWSSLGRRNRKTWPDRFAKSNGGFSNNLAVREIFHGRLLCDIANELGHSLTPKCQSWDLPEMYDVVCQKKQSVLEINYNNPRYSEDAKFLMMALKENATNCKITAEIGFVIQIMSLSKQLTNLAGNSWAHTLSGTRSGRNEFVLLHEFHRNKYIVPDKEDKYHKNSINPQVESNGDEVTSNKKSKYQGGLVFEPEKGLHKNYVLVMDFNSLYPSIIQEFNICFTTVDREKFNRTHDESKDLPNFPEAESSAGVLPKLLNTLVSRRREVKKLLKDPSNTPVEKAQFDIKQQALKLTANSMYGCLGYTNSRFYAKPLAMLVTNKGREILMDTRQLAESIGLRVVYGDTDSVMIDTGVTELKEAIKIGNEFKVQVNERYKLLELDIDNAFKRILLHAKKKYAAMDSSIDKTTGKEVLKLEVKGLDMRRREYCQLSKDISIYILNKILGAEDPEQALLECYDYFEEMSTKIRNNEIPIDKYKINTRLSKDPTNYPGGKTMPPVQVALRMREQGKVVKAGTVITYVITESNQEQDQSSPADRARAFQEVMNKSSGLRPDANYYLEKQIFAPVERLLERIEGIDMVRVASTLGIDTKKYLLKVKNSEANGEIVSLESSISDAERFRQSSYLSLSCKCGANFRFGGIQASNDYKVTFNGVVCSKCNHTFTPLQINAQLETAIRTHLAVYYSGWVVCDDGACGITTRQISVYGKRCLGSSGKAHGCKGVMRYKYSDKALYNQLLYFDAIFDVQKAKLLQLKSLYDYTVDPATIPSPIPRGQLDALAEQNRELFGTSQEVVQKYLSNCGRRYVDMSSIFDFMMPK